MRYITVYNVGGSTVGPTSSITQDDRGRSARAMGGGKACWLTDSGKYNEHCGIPAIKLSRSWPVNYLVDRLTALSRFQGHKAIVAGASHRIQPSLFAKLAHNRRRLASFRSRILPQKSFLLDGYLRWRLFCFRFLRDRTPSWDSLPSSLRLLRESKKSERRPHEKTAE